MRIANLLFTAAAFLSSQSNALDASTNKQVTVWAWQLDTKTPQELARIAYNANDLSTSVKTYTPPKSSYVAAERVRVGLYDPKTSTWRGIVTSASSFDPIYQQRLTINVDHSGEPYHVGFSAHAKMSAQALAKAKRKAERSAARASGAKKDEVKKIEREEPQEPQLSVEIDMPVPGPTPHLNKPVVLSPEGKAPEAEPEKTFLQKYWWVMAAFLVLQVVMAGSGSEEKK